MEHGPAAAGWIWEALRRGGLAVPKLPTIAGELQRLAEVQLSKYDGLSDPAGAEQLGKALAERVRSRAASVVLVWEDPEDVVLGYIVGRELGVPVVRMYNADGLVGYVGQIAEGCRALLVSDAFRDPLTPRAMRAVVLQQGGEVVGVAALVEPAFAAPETELLVSLVSIRAHVAERASDGAPVG